MIKGPGCKLHLHAGAARPQHRATAVHTISRPWPLRFQQLIPSRCQALGRHNGISDHAHEKQHSCDLSEPGQQEQQQAGTAAADLQQQTDKQTQVLQQPQQQPWLLHYMRSPRLVGAFMAAALLVFVPGTGKQAAAVASTLPQPWQTVALNDAGGSSITADSSRNSMGFPLPAQDLMHLSSLNPDVPTNERFQVDASTSSTAIRRNNDKLHPAADVSSTSFNGSRDSSSSSTAMQEAAFPASSSTGSNSSTALNPGSGNSSSSSSSGPAGHNSALDELLAYERATVNLFAAALPCVVNITHMRAMQNFYTLDIHHMAVGQGSGFIWDKLGHVVTNYHVIKGAAEVKVTLYDHSSCTARVVGWDERKDIAVLKLALPRGRLETLHPVTLGSSSSLRVGQSCFAIGNPFGLDHTLTQGIVSGLGRELSTGLSAIKNVIQTDAAINPGNSGGVLLNSQGAVIGVNLGILDFSGKGSFSGVGFAIPIDTVKGLVEQILAHGRVRRPSLGITIAPGQVLAQLGTEGVLVLEVPAGTPAAAAGLRATYRDVFGDIVLGDIIVGMDTRPVRSTADLIAALDERRPGDKVRCDVLRDGKRLSMTVTLGERGSSCE